MVGIGDGNVDVAPNARLNLAGTRGFTGSVTGEGVVGIADNAVLDFGDGTVPLIVLDHPLELGTNVTVRTTGRNSRFRLASAPSFTGAENIESWTVADIGDRPYRFMVTKDGKNLDLSLIASLLVIIR